MVTGIATPNEKSSPKIFHKYNILKKHFHSSLIEFTRVRMDYNGIIVYEHLPEYLNTRRKWMQCVLEIFTVHEFDNIIADIVKCKDVIFWDVPEIALLLRAEIDYWNTEISDLEMDNITDLCEAIYTYVMNIAQEVEYFKKLECRLTNSKWEESSDSEGHFEEHFAN